MQISFYRKSTTLSFALIFAFPIIDDLRLLIKTKRKVDEQVAAGRQKQNKVDSFNKQTTANGNQPKIQVFFIMSRFHIRCHNSDFPAATEKKVENHNCGDEEEERCENVDSCY